ncbi:MAG TPA: hypothetical protein VNM22_09135 [Candidatus Limnocylindrales bacterium]|nr:hypothetical protein [Candidatus Limnocylindrales bacterium]
MVRFYKNPLWAAMGPIPVVGTGKNFLLLSSLLLILIGLNKHFAWVPEIIFLIPILLFIVTSFISGSPISRLLSIILVVFTPFEYLAYIIPFLYIPRVLLSRHNSRLSKSIKFFLLLLLCWVLIDWGVSQVRELNLLSLVLFFITFLSPFIVMVGISMERISWREVELLSHAFIRFSLLQLIPVLVGQIFRKDWFPGDSNFGSLRSTNEIALIMIVALTVILFDRSRRISNITSWREGVLIPSIGCAYLLFESETKHLLISLIIAGFLYIIIRIIASKKLPIKTKILFSGSLVFGSLFIAFITPYVGNLYIKYLVGDENRTLQDYLATYTDPNHKLVFAQRILSRDYPWLIGAGPGTISSKASNSRASDTMYKEQGSRLFNLVEPFTSKLAKEYYVDLYDEEWAVQAQWRSAALTNPFSSHLAIIAELGIMGWWLVASLYLSMVLSAEGLKTGDSRKDSIIVAGQVCALLIFVASLFDTYMEVAQFMLVTILFVGLPYASLKPMVSIRSRIKVIENNIDGQYGTV